MDAALIALLSGLVFFAYHFYAVDPKTGLRLIYPLQVPLAKLSSRCSENAPLWMSELIDHIIEEQFSLSNQIAYVSPTGALHHCESGWKGEPLLSPSISTKTRFRFASVTKLLTADAVLARINSGDLSINSRLLDVITVSGPLLDPRLSDVTIGQLLRHRGGFDRLKSVDPMTRHMVTPWCPGKPEQLARLRLDFSPNERFSYSNLGYCLLGIVLEKVSGKSFRDIIDEEYGLSARGIKFIDGPYLADEVNYDYRNSSFYGPGYYRYFDFSALSSSAGLSGSAVSLAMLLKEKLERKPLNLLSAKLDKRCDTRHAFECFGFAVSPFRKDGDNLTLYVQAGLLFGASSSAAIDSKGGVVIWLGNGMSLQPHKAAVGYVERLQADLSEYYKTR